MNEEISIILKMVEDGKISADKAKELIGALENNDKNTEAIVSQKYEDKFLKIEVLSHEGDTVNIRLPIKAVKELIKVTGKLPISASVKGMDNIDIDSLVNTLTTCLDNKLIGEIVNITSSEGDTVKIFID